MTILHCTNDHRSPISIVRRRDEISASGSGPSAARPAASAQEVEKASGLKGSPHRIRSGALLLPVPLRPDGQHSSSQLLIIINDARWTSFPSGRYSFQNPRKSLYFHDLPDEGLRRRSKFAHLCCAGLAQPCSGGIGAIRHWLYPFPIGGFILGSTSGQRTPPPSAP